MKTPRRFLPSMSLLRAFEAAARHESFTAAAAELDLTQGAISRQIRVIEELLGSDLFVRERQTVRLTPAGETYAREIQTALQRISKATLDFRANPKGGTLNLAILPTFGTKWLAPRLADFLRENPSVAVNLTTRLAPFDFELEQLDAAIHYGDAEWPDAELEYLMGEMVIPAASSSLIRAHGFRQPSDLLNAPLLHLVSRPDAWERWFETNDVAVESLHGMLFDQYGPMIQAAITGVGVALLPEFLAREEFARRELVPASDRRVPGPGSYFLAWPSGRSAYPPLVAFRKWLVEEARHDEPRSNPE